MQQDKTDFYWNGELAGAINNLYYDLINVDVVHVPYATTHRNSSFFLKTRPGYVAAESWLKSESTDGWEARDIRIIWEDSCTKEEGTAYVLGKKGRNKAIFAADIKDGCVGGFFNCTAGCVPTSDDDMYDECPDTSTEGECGDWKLFTTNYVKGMRHDGTELAQPTGQTTVEDIGVLSGIQINKYTSGTTIGLFSDEYVESGDYEFTNLMCKPGNYLLVYESDNGEESGFAGQVRMITGVDDSSGVKRITVNAPWSGFKVINSLNLEEGEEKEDPKGKVSYAVFSDWGEVLGFTAGKKIYLLPFDKDCKALSPYNQESIQDTPNIIGVAEANEKIFVLTDNGFIHYCSESEYGGYDKFFIQDDMFAGVDKSSITAYKDFILAFGRKHIAVGVPDEKNKYYTMYNQSANIGLWSRYAYAEYDGDLVFVSNDKRLLALGVSATAGRYMLQSEDVGQMLNGKLSTMIDTDEVYVGSDGNNLRVFVQTKSTPYVEGGWVPNSGKEADINMNGSNTMTHIYKFDTLFKIWSEDHVSFLISGAAEGVYYGEDGLYSRRYSEAKYPDYPECDVQGTDTHTKWPYQAKISAYLIENESNWLGNNSWLQNRPKLFHLAKLNRLITTLGPGIYTSNTKIKITDYTKGIGLIYEFPINGDGNKWLGMMTDLYNNRFDGVDECLLSIIQDSQSKYQPTCTDTKVGYITETQKFPRCDTYKEMLIQNHGVCINDSLYELAPTMPLTTSLGENQQYATQIKIELISGDGDIICFGGRLAELFVAPLFTNGPDGEYELQPNSSC